ncbi:MAG TPA: FAD-dependent oxidoreductase [Gaiellaceae bacterium]
MQTECYWLDRPKEPLAIHVEVSSKPVDVAVVGGGVTGCSCALALADRGLRVRLYEARLLAGGASGRNGGFALRGSAERYDRVRARLGADVAGGLWELSERALAAIERLAGDAFRRVGSLQLAADPRERRLLQDEFEALREDGLGAQWIDQLPGPLDRSYHGAILHPGDGALEPARWVRRLAGRAAAAGVEIVEGRRVEVDSVPAATVVVAVDGLTSALLPELGRVVWPVRGQVVVTEPLVRRLFERPHYARHGFDYWQQLPDARLLVGGQRDACLEAENTAVEETTPVVQERLDAFVSGLVGGRPRITHRWAGIWGETVDKLPLAGRVPGRERVWIAGGYSGHGNVLGFACGELVARAVAGEDPPELGLFDPGRFGATGGPGGSISGEERADAPA